MKSIIELPGEERASLLDHQCQTIEKSRLTLPEPDFVSRVCTNSDRKARVLRSLETLFAYGRLSQTGYLTILPMDQGFEHSADHQQKYAVTKNKNPRSC